MIIETGQYENIYCDNFSFVISPSPRLMGYFCSGTSASLADYAIGGIIHVETALQKCRMVHSQTNFQNEADTKDLLDCLSDVMGGPPFQRKPTNSM